MIENTTQRKTFLRSLEMVYPLFVFGILLLTCSFTSYSQTVSIGVPVDGTEGTTNASFTVFIEGGGVNTGSQITGLINYSGSANLPSDFFGAMSFAIPNGVDSVQIPLTLVDNNWLQLDRTITATISNLSSGTIGSSVSSATILDDDLAQLQVSIGEPANTIEGSGNMTFKVSFEGGVINQTGLGITGDLTYSGTATNGSDYTGFATFSLGGGMTSQNVSVIITDDAIAESPETVTATISNMNYGSILTGSSTATIFDDDSGDILVSIGYGTIGTEGSTDVSFRAFIVDGGVNTTGSSITGSVSYTGTASDGVDYTGPVSFSIPVGASADTIDIPVIDDAIPEQSETVIATLSNLSTGYIVNPTRATWIGDDDTQSLVISIGSPVNAVEGTSDVSFDIFIEGGGVNNSTIPIVGTFYFLGSTALFGADFAPINDFVIPVGASSTTVTFTVYDDYILEPTEIINISLLNLNLGSFGNSASSAEIIDDDSGQYSILLSSFIDGTEGLADVSLTVSLDNGVVNTTGVPITGALSYSGTANFFLDVVSLPDSFSIADGANSAQIMIPVVDDILVECDESIIATISDQSIGTIDLATDTAYIIDNECAIAAISIHSPSDGAELGSDVQFTVSLDGGLTNGTGSFITGTLDLSGGTATPGVDFVDQQTFEIGIGANSTTINISVIDEFDIEATESIIATISNLSFATIGTATSTAYILDNDSISGIISVETLDLSIYPNPMSENLSFESEYQMKSYSIVDLNGRELSAGEINAKEFMLNTKLISAGSYLVSVLFENGNSVSKKLIKN